MIVMQPEHPSALDVGECKSGELDCRSWPYPKGPMSELWTGSLHANEYFRHPVDKFRPSTLEASAPRRRSVSTAATSTLTLRDEPLTSSALPFFGDFVDLAPQICVHKRLAPPSARAPILPHPIVRLIVHHKRAPSWMRFGQALNLGK